MNDLITKYSLHHSISDIDAGDYGWVEVFVEQDGPITVVNPDPLADNPDDFYGYTEVNWQEVAVSFYDENGVRYITDNKDEIREVMSCITGKARAEYEREVECLLTKADDEFNGGDCNGY
jgi:hypothetical protein